MHTHTHAHSHAHAHSRVQAYGRFHTSETVQLLSNLPRFFCLHTCSTVTTCQIVGTLISAVASITVESQKSKSTHAVIQGHLLVWLGMFNYRQPAVPQLALREALINAFCHRNYNERSASPHLAIYDDRLEIWNPGALPPGITLEQLKKPHHSFPRNELIANVFYKRGWIEKWGTGTTRMVEFCKKNNTPEPTFSEEFHGFSVVFSFKEAMNSGITINSSTAIHQLTSRQQEILNLLNKSEAMSANNIIDKLEMPPAPRTLRDDLMCLKKNGLIDSKGHAKKTIWFKIKPT